MAAPIVTDSERPRARLAAFVQPLAAAIVLLCGCLVAWRPIAVAAPDRDPLLRLFPFDSRWDARAGIAVTALGALMVAVVARGNAGRRMRRGLGVLGLAIGAYAGFVCARAVRHDCYRWEGCDFWHVPFFFADAALLLLASAALLVWARHEPARRLRWIGAAAVVALAGLSAAWTYRATPTLRRYGGADLANVHLQGFFEANNDDFAVPPPPPEGAPPGDDPAAEARDRVPPAVPALPMRGEKMLCVGDWRVVKFPDRDRCLPRRPLVTIQPDEVELVSVAIPQVGAPPELILRLRSDAARRFATALRTAGSFRFVLLDARGQLIADVAQPWPIPGPAFGLRPGREGAAETERMLRVLLGRP